MEGNEGSLNSFLNIRVGVDGFFDKHSKVVLADLSAQRKGNGIRLCGDHRVCANNLFEKTLCRCDLRKS